LSESAKRFTDVWHKAERGEKVERQDLLTFDDLETLLGILTPARWSLLRRLRREGPMSVRALSKLLTRDYKNVHTDVRELEHVGLITRTKDEQVIVPWDIVVAEVRLEAA
jgi:predicted transcriptional regulator